jgi:tetratricopeptide (TPR) repeat protein
MAGTRFATLAIMGALALGACGGRTAAWEETEAKPAASTSGGATPAADTIQQMLVAGDAAWEQRDSEDKLREALGHWEKVIEADPKNAAAWEKLARGYYLLADGHVRFHSGDGAEADMLATFEKGVTVAERGLVALFPAFGAKMRDGAKIEEAAAELDKSGVPLLYWRASSLGKWASAKGFATLLSHKDEIKQTMQVCLDKDAAYFYAGPDRYFGVFYARAPSFAGGDLVKSKEHFEKSLAAHPNYFGTHTLMAADLAVKSQDRKMFDEHLDYVINGDPNSIPELGPENRIEQKKAALLKKQGSELFE